MADNSKRRILELIDIMRKNTDMDHQLSQKQIYTILEERGFIVKDRKTLYDDFKMLNDYGYTVEYDHGYYLSEAPFSKSEIKILIDSLNSLKNLDNSLLEKMNNKLYSFISKDEENLLKKLEYHNRHSDKKFIHRLEDVLSAIQNNELVIMKRRNKDENETIGPLFLYRNNDLYYLYYHYLNNEKIYHVRFDNIINVKLIDTKDDIVISRSTIINNIEASSNSFYSNKATEVRFKIINYSEYLKNRIIDDFPNAILTNDGFSIKASINDAFFSKLVSYGDDIKISDKDIANQYIEFLNKIITRNKAKD